METSRYSTRVFKPLRAYIFTSMFIIENMNYVDILQMLGRIADKSSEVPCIIVCEGRSRNDAFVFGCGG